MAWQIPQSQTIAGVVADLMTTDDVFVASGVTIASTGDFAIEGTGSNHEALIYGTVASSSDRAITLGDDATADSNETVTIKPGGQVHTFAPIAAIGLLATSSQVTNQGLISGPFGISLFGISATTTSTIVNSGTIDVDQNAIVRAPTSTETIVLQNSGLISAGNLAYDSNATPNARDIITNTGQMIGDIELAAGNDVYDGAQGRLNGDVRGQDGNDVITGGIDNDVLFGDDGNDTLNGGNGNDMLDGGSGLDIIRGGLGKDSMFGSDERDLFDFDSIKDSLKGAKRDVIQDFVRGTNVTGDDIDLRTIDAKTGVAGNNKFKFIGKQDFNDVKGELRYEDKGAQVIVQGDRNGDGKADFEILVKVGALAAGDFLL